VGSYPSSCSGAVDPNYTIGYVDGSVSVGAAPAPALTLVKKADTATYDHVGQLIHYTYTVTNTGNVDISALAVTDDNIDASTSVTCDAPSLAPLASTTCHAVRTVGQGDLNAGSISNNAKATGTPSGGNLTPATASVTVKANQRPRLSLTKTPSPTTYTKAGDVITYTFVLTNSGNVTLPGPFTIVDPIADATCQATPASLAPGDKVTCTGTYTVTQADVNLGFILNIAVGQGQFGGRTVSSLPAFATVTATPAPALTLAKSADTSMYSLNQVIHYSYKLTNTGNVTIYGPFTVTDDKIQSPNSVTCPATPSLAPGAFVTCAASYTATTTDMTNGSITNTATGHAHRYLVGQTLVNSNSDSVTVTAAGPALTLKKSADATTYDANQLITYSYLVTNTGNVTITDLAVTDDKIALVTCTDTTLAAGAHTTCTGTYTTDQGDVDHGSVTNNASVTGTPAAGNLAPATDSLTIDAAGPALTLKKSAQEDSFSAAGDLIHYSYVIKNTGNVALDGPFTVADDKTPVTCPATPTTLAVGDSITCTATYTVTAADVTGLYVINKATAQAANNGDPVTSAEVSLTVPIESVKGKTFTPPPTNTPSRQGPDGNSTPLFALLISFAFGSLALVTVQAQRRSIRR
jgi:uncharacterized repeat protein (TIGR01451 family)